MNTYLVICGIILNILLVAVIVYGIIDEIRVRRINKIKAAEKALKDALYKEELLLAERVWQQWAKKIRELQQACDKEKDPHKLLVLQSKMFAPSFERYYFASLGTWITLHDLGEKNDWVLQNDSLN